MKRIILHFLKNNTKYRTLIFKRIDKKGRSFVSGLCKNEDENWVERKDFRTQGKLGHVGVLVELGEEPIEDEGEAVLES